jgi:predicted GTPase
MKKSLLQFIFISLVFFASCSEKRGIDKIKEGVEEVSEDTVEKVEESKKKIKIKFEH